jgi:hypothetical protein
MNFKNFNLFDKNVLAAAMLSVAALTTSCSKDDNKAPVQAEQNMASSSAIQDRYMIVYKDNKFQQADGARSISVNGISVTPEAMLNGSSNGFIANLTPEQAEQLKNNPDIAYVEQDQAVAFGRKKKGTATADVTPLSAGSGMIAADQTINGQLVPWGVTRLGGIGNGTGKTAWIIDSGVDYNNTEINLDKTRSKSFLSSANGGNYSSPTDEYGHGTKVASIIAAKNDNTGAVGIAAGATVVSLKVMDYLGRGSTGSLVRAVNWAATYGKAGDVVNISLGCPASTTLDNAVKACAAKGIYVVSAAGNSNADCSNLSPQRVNATNVYTVSAMKEDNSFFTGMSDYGSPVDFAAPGRNVYTTDLGGGHTYNGGTSFASPFVAGILLTNGKAGLRNDGYVTSDPDSKPDPIAHK